MFKKYEKKWVWEENIKEDFMENTFKMVTDFDGVITNPHMLKKTAFKSLGFDVTLEETSRENFNAKYPKNQKIYDQVTRLVNVENLSNVPLINGCRRTIHQISTLKNVSLLILTYRTRNETLSLLNYLEEKRIAIKVVIPTMNNFKGDYLKLITPHLFIDDSVSTLRKLDGNRDNYKFLKKCKLVLYTHFANLNSEISLDNIQKVENWEEISKIFHNAYFRTLRLSNENL